MEQARLNELKNQMHEMRQKDLQISAKVDAKAINLSELKYEQKSYKKLHASDLPIYRKWINGNNLYFYRGRIVDGKLICDKIHIEKDSIEYLTTFLSTIMSEDNEESNQEEFNNAICKLITYLEK
jgi:hypothetical protein